MNLARAFSSSRALKTIPFGWCKRPSLWLRPQEPARFGLYLATIAAGAERAKCGHSEEQINYTNSERSCCFLNVS